jgi:ArsR family transcriptional regulator
MNENSHINETCAVTKALADGSRLRVIAALMEQDELCVCQITELLQLATATVSRHMSVLQNARLVKGRKNGRWVYYGLSDSFPPVLRQWLLQSLSQSVEIAADRRKLQTILACRPETLQVNSKRSDYIVS